MKGSWVAQPRRLGDRGAVGGIEILPFGLLVFVVGGLLVFNAWVAVDAKTAVVAAAREGARAAAETVEGPEAAAAAARHRVAETMRAHGYGQAPRRSTTVDVADYRRCGRIGVSVAYRVPGVALPIVGGYRDGFVMRATHTEIVDGYRSGLATTTSAC